MKVVVGLGNPGPKYEVTPHNVGFLVVDQLIEHWKATGPQKKFDAEIYQANVPGVGQVLLVKPQTFMNLSGRSVAPLSTFYKIQPDDMIVVHDELDLPPFSIRLKTGGGSGGHNGIKSLDECLGAENKGYHRLRIGIGKPLHGDGADHVLRPYSSSELPELDKVLDTSVKAIETWLMHGMKRAMNEFNKHTKTETKES